ncbi:chalcone isomerase family protein (plasmid) [Pseudoalteromonas sp. T1lg65]|uniref:chalcone isomerase family protein n=1 Tax=Pseudoalteromonas sp. T1lg65 TaxID=2077101 RepID=UPI003F7A7632
MRYLIVALLFASCLARAELSQVEKLIPNPQLVGETSRMTYVFWDVYDATLYATNGQYSNESPYVLKLAYLRDLDGEAIAERSLKEMQKQGFSDKALGQSWLVKMKSIFPNVSKGTVLYGVRNEQGFTEFYHGEKQIGLVADEQFTNWFFAIWLSEKTSEPEMRAEILGLRSTS